jgi:hypothetical protein
MRRRRTLDLGLLVVPCDGLVLLGVRHGLRGGRDLPNRDASLDAIHQTGQILIESLPRFAADLGLALRPVSDRLCPGDPVVSTS